MTLPTFLEINQLLSHLRSKGFDKTFDLNDQLLYCLQTSRWYSPQELELVEYHRIAASNAPDSGRIVFAINCHDGDKGILNVPLKEFAGVKLLKFMDQIKVKTRE